MHFLKMILGKRNSKSYSSQKMEQIIYIESCFRYIFWSFKFKPFLKINLKNFQKKYLKIQVLNVLLRIILRNLSKKTFYIYNLLHFLRGIRFWGPLLGNNFQKIYFWSKYLTIVIGTDIEKRYQIIRFWP